jgi:hypothetical protein
MDQKNREQQIEAYLADEEKLFGDWYRGLGQPDFDPDMIPVGISPKTEKIKKIFNDWLEKNKNTLKAGICSEWKELLKQEVVSVSMIAMLADTLGTLHFPIPVNVTAASAILLTRVGIEHLCTDKQVK